MELSQSCESRPLWQSDCGVNMAPTQNTATLKSDGILNKNIFDILGLSNLPEDQKAELLKKILKIIYQRASARIMDALGKDDLRKLTRAIESEDEKSATALLATHGLSSFEELMTEEALFIKYEMKALVRGDALLSE